MAIFTNADGLRVKFWRDEAVKGQGGTFSGPSSGGTNVTEFWYDFTDVGATFSIIDDSIVIPSGVLIEKVDVIATTVHTSAGSTLLDVGLVRLDRTTELDFNGFVAALAKTALDGAGETNSIVLGSTGAGALIGTVTAFAGVPCMNTAVGPYTAGKGVVRIYWSKVMTINS